MDFTFAFVHRQTGKSKGCGEGPRRVSALDAPQKRGGRGPWPRHTPPTSATCHPRACRGKRAHTHTCTPLPERRAGVFHEEVPKSSAAHVPGSGSTSHEEASAKEVTGIPNFPNVSKTGAAFSSGAPGGGGPPAGPPAAGAELGLVPATDTQEATVQKLVVTEYRDTDRGSLSSLCSESGAGVGGAPGRVQRSSCQATATSDTTRPAAPQLELVHAAGSGLVPSDDRRARRRGLGRGPGASATAPPAAAEEARVSCSGASRPPRACAVFSPHPTPTPTPGERARQRGSAGAVGCTTHTRRTRISWPRWRSRSPRPRA